MEVITGIGGLFFRARAPRRLARWYQAHFGFPGHPIKLWEAR
jgi:hypothetical protein